MMLGLRLQSFCQEHHLIHKADTIIVAVSGGKDSVTLLHLLYQLRRVYGLRLAVAHCNHRLRPSADRDEQFVSRLAQHLNLPHYIHRSAVKKPRGSIEEIARVERFSFLARLALKLKADAIALAHTRDDLAETLLMRLIRGGGTKGLAAIIPQRTIRGGNFIRPLLFASRDDVKQYLKKHQLKFREDPTNKQKKFLRNRIRLELLPLLEENYNPNIKEILAQTAANAAADYDFLARHAAQCLARSCESRSRRHITLNSKRLLSLPLAMQRLVIRLAIEALLGHTRTITFKHIDEMIAQQKMKLRNSLIDLPKGLKARITPTNIKLYTSKA